MILKQFELNWFLFFSLEELVKPLEDYSRWNMEMDLFISQNQKTTLSSTQQWKWISPTTIQETYWKEIHNQFGVLCFQQCWERWREFKKNPFLSSKPKWLEENSCGWSGLKSMWIIHWDDLESMWIILILSYESEDRLFRVELAGCGDVTRLWCMAVLGGAVEGKWRSGDWHCSMCVCCFLHLPQFSF